MQNKPGTFSIYSDEVLMDFIMKGEVRAFDELYARYSKRLLVYFTRMLNFDKTIAEDALQDLFLKIAEVPERFDKSRSFKTWIFSIASNQCKNYYRHQKIVSESAEEIKYMNEHTNDQAFLKAASKMDAVLFRTMLDEVLNSIAVEKKEAFILKYQEEKTIAEIAWIQDCPEGSVKSRLHYTLKILEEKLHLFKPTH
jgi:RNA polymerase sigma-70 factor (ECF subfamily)